MKGAGMGGGGGRWGEWQLHFNTSLLDRIWQHFKGVDESGFVVPGEGKGIAGGVQDVGQGVGLSMVVSNSENGEVGVFPMRVVGGVRYSMVVNNWDWQGVSLFQWGGWGGGGGNTVWLWITENGRVGFCPSGTPPLRLRHDCCTAGTLAPVIHVPFNPSFNIKNHTKNPRLVIKWISLRHSTSMTSYLHSQNSQGKAVECPRKWESTLLTSVSLSMAVVLTRTSLALAR